MCRCCCSGDAHGYLRAATIVDHVSRWPSPQDAEPGRPPAGKASRAAGRSAAGWGDEVSPEGSKPATSVNVQLLRLRKDLHMGSISRDIVNFPSELCRCRSGMFTEVARLVPPDKQTKRPKFSRPSGEGRSSSRAGALTRVADARAEGFHTEVFQVRTGCAVSLRCREMPSVKRRMTRPSPRPS